MFVGCFGVKLELDMVTRESERPRVKVEVYLGSFNGGDPGDGSKLPYT